MLAEDLSSTHLNFQDEEEKAEEEVEVEDVEQEDDDEEEEDIFMTAAPSSKQDILNSLSVRSTDERRPSSNTFSVPNERKFAVEANSSRLYKHSITPQTNVSNQSIDQ